MKKLILIPTLMFLGIAFGISQTCLNNPSVQAGDIDPAPLVNGQGGTLSFTYTENGDDYTEEENDPVTVTICLLNIAPVSGVASIGGTFAGHFDWLYDVGTNCFLGTQNQDILGGSGGSITVEFVQTNSIACPSNQMGFNTNIQPAACMNGINLVNDDNESSFTCNRVLDDDGDGVTDDIETIDGTDPNDFCSFILTSQNIAPTPAWEAADCDGDGVTNAQEVIDETDPLDPCDYMIVSVTLTITSGADCDGDGVTEGDEISDSTDPTDPCDLVLASQSVTPSATWLLDDCDGDGAINGQEVTDNTDPLDPCDPMQVTGYTGYDSSNTLWSAADCDGDGVSNGNEDDIAGGGFTDPYDPCDFNSGESTLVVTAVTDCDGDGVDSTTDPDDFDPCDPAQVAGYAGNDSSNAIWSAADCDGDGVSNGVEDTNGTDPYDPCDFNSGEITLAVTAVTDCDGDGVDSTTDPDDFDPCDPVQSIGYTGYDASNAIWSAADCDGDGVPNGVEDTNGTDPYDPCDYNEVEQGTPDAAWDAADCDDDGNPNGGDPNPLTTVAVDDVGMASLGVTTTIDILVNDDYLPNNDPANLGTTTITDVGTGSAGGTIMFDPATGELDYTPLVLEAGSIVTVVYEVCNTDLAPDVCSQAMVTISVDACSDLSPIITAVPSNISGPTTINVVIDVAELGAVNTSGLITVRVPVDSRLSFTYEPSLMMLGLFTVENSTWTYQGSNGLFHTFTTTDVLLAGSTSTFGFAAQYDPQNTDGETTMSATVVFGSGGECIFVNNFDDEVIIYFE